MYLMRLWLRTVFSSEQLKLFIPHQANKRILEATAKRLGLSADQTFVNVHKYGNTSGATIPIAIDEANQQGLFQEGDLILTAAFGGGFTWGFFVNSLVTVTKF